MRREKETTRDFYDSFGWRKDAAGLCNDTATFVEVRPVNMWYLGKVHLRVAQFFNRGRYFLDAGTGAIPFREYLVSGSSDSVGCVEGRIRLTRIR